MALTRTTLGAALAAKAKTMTVASGTGFAANYLVRIDNEMLRVTQDYTSGTTVNVLRGVNGTKQADHVITAGVVVGAGSDFSDPGEGGPSVILQTQKATLVTSVTATSSLALSPAGTDQRVILNGTSVITLTVPVPTKEKDGDMLVIISNGAAAHLITYTGGLGGAGTNYDVITNNATGKGAWVTFAANETWQMPQAPALTGTVTNITGGIA